MQIRFLPGSILTSLSIFLFCHAVFAADPNNTNTVATTAVKEDVPPSIGNFALPFSQQPGPLISFGQNTLNKNQSQLFLFADDIVGSGSHFVDLAPGFIYGMTDSTTVLFSIPYAVSYQQNNKHSQGVEDATVQLEYNLYSKSTKQFTDQVTVVGAITTPTGSYHKQPPTGHGAPAFFFGTTLNRTYVDWLGFTSYGAILTTSNDESKTGNQFLYQAGIGRNIYALPKEWLVAGILELTGTYSAPNRVNGATDPNSGGNIVYATPSIWISTLKLIFQLGVGVPVSQHWRGEQTNNKYLVSANVIWTLN